MYFKKEPNISDDDLKQGGTEILKIPGVNFLFTAHPQINENRDILFFFDPFPFMESSQFGNTKMSTRRVPHVIVSSFDEQGKM